MCLTKTCIIVSLEYQKELLTFNAESIYETLAESMSCDIKELVKQVNQLVDLEEAKIVESIEKYSTF